jgi:hypothetical protein
MITTSLTVSTRLMNLFRMTICFSTMLACVCAGRTCAAPVSYSVKFDATWSQTSHPNAYPPGAHFSSLIGGVHNDQVAFWIPGGLASAGIEQMAEVGGTTALRNEVQAAINAGTAAAVIQGSGIPSPGSTTITVNVTLEFPLVTLVSMVAPTPDWFIGVHGFNLRDGGSWINEATVDLFGYDAGTEQGTGFSLSNPETVPPQPIALLDFPFMPDPKLGTFTFTRIFTGRGIGDYDDNGTVDAADYVIWRSSHGESGRNLPADGNLDGMIDAADFGIWKAHFGQSLAVGASTVSGVFALSTPEPVSACLLATAVICLSGSTRVLTCRCPREDKSFHVCDCGFDWRGDYVAEVL